MKDVVQVLLDRLSAMRGNIRPAWVTYRRYKSEEYQALLRTDAIEDGVAEPIASFIKRVAISARVPEVVGIAELVRREARAIEEANPEEWDDPPPPDTPREIVGFTKMVAAFWKPHAEREAAEQARWQQTEWISTLAIAERLIPRCFSSTDVFRLLKELGYVRGLPRNYELTDQAAGIGEVRGHPRRRGRIHWRREMFDIVQREISRRQPPEG